MPQAQATPPSGHATAAVPPHRPPCMQDAEAGACYAAHGGIVTTLVANCCALHVLAADAAAPAGAAATILDADTTLYLHLQGLLDPKAEISKLQKQRAAAESRASTLEVLPLLCWTAWAALRRCWRLDALPIHRVWPQMHVHATTRRSARRQACRVGHLAGPLTPALNSFIPRTQTPPPQRSSVMHCHTDCSAA